MMEKEIFDLIESNTFMTKMNLASNFRTFLMALNLESEISSLISLCKENMEKGKAVLVRIEQLAKLECDFRYENPFDVALATYAWILDGAQTELSQIAIEFLTKPQQTWWARYMAEYLLNKHPSLIAATKTKTKQEIYESVEQNTVLNNSSKPPQNTQHISRLAKDLINSRIVTKFDMNSLESNISEIDVWMPPDYPYSTKQNIKSKELPITWSQLWQ